MRLTTRTCRIALAAAVATAASSACEGAGFYNMPTSLQQCLGIGWGPGYHAPMTLVVPCRSKTASQKILWQWNAPQPPTACAYGSCVAGPPQQVYHPQPAPTPAHHYQAPEHYYYSAPARQVTPPATSTPSPGINSELTPLEPASPSDINQPEQIPLPRN